MQREAPRISLRQPEKNPLTTLAASRNVSFTDVNPSHAKALEAAFAKAEVGLCSYATTVSVGKELEIDFLVHPNQIVLSERVFARPSILDLHLRHAVELTLWFQMCEQNWNSVRAQSVALLAAFTTTRFYLQLPISERKQIAGKIPDWLKESAEAAAMLSEKEVLKTVAPHLSSLLSLQGTSLEDPALIDEALEISSQYLAVANPTEFILTQQGDERLLIDPATGLNKYGCSPRPRPDAITFSSCTASSVSEFAFREAELLRQRLMQTLPRRTFATQFEVEMEAVRTGLRELLDLDASQTEIILSSSGTDAELYPLALFHSPGKKLVNIIVAPDEVGSGTVLAAGGRHFSVHSPLGKTLRQGEPIQEIGAESIDVACIPIRKDGSSRLTQAELKQHITAAITEAGKVAETIILHIVDNTKTGVVAPDVDFVLTLKGTFGSKLQVVVDACQFRLEKSNLRRYLSHGFCVLITGSKFFTGPPFCGALLIPDKAQTRATTQSFPIGFSDYFTRSELPPSLRARAKHFPATLNLGLLFRWVGAVNEMKYFYSVDSSQRTNILQTFRSRLIESIVANHDLHLLECPEVHRWTDCDRSLWDAQPTIFSFAVKNPKCSEKKWLQIRALKKIYVLLNCDCSARLPQTASAEERRLASQKCHIGQPVTTSRCSLNGETGALRIACGARLVYGITYDAGLGNNPKERFERELADARTVLAKVSLILKYGANLGADRIS